MKYHFKIHPAEEGGYWAKCLELPGCVTEGDTLEELQENMEDALNTYIDEPADSTDLAALPDEKIKKSQNIVEVPVDPSIALGFQMRLLRLKEGLTQKEVSEKMGFKSLYSYQRLESGKENPKLKTFQKIKEIFPEFSVDFLINA